MNFVEHQHPLGAERRVNRSRASWLSPVGTGAGIAVIVLRCLESTSLRPFAPLLLRSFFATMSALTPARSGSSGLGP